jgi:hypothetical protein
LSRLLRTLYQLRYHEFAGWELDRWLATLTIGAGLLVWLIGRSDPGPTAMLESATLALVGIAVLLLRRWAAGRMYVVFRPQPECPAPSGLALDPTDKISLRVTGEFEVEGKQHFFADLLAYWRTFATREHAVMAIQHASRYLLLGSMPGRDVGMWYIFFQPAMLTGVAPGQLIWGGQGRLALRVSYNLPLTVQPSLLRSLLRLPVETSERRLVYLAFDDEPGRSQVWADLLADERMPVARAA